MRFESQLGRFYQIVRENRAYAWLISFLVSDIIYSRRLQGFFTHYNSPQCSHLAIGERHVTPERAGHLNIISMRNITLLSLIKYQMLQNYYQRIHFLYACSIVQQFVFSMPYALHIIRVSLYSNFTIHIKWIELSNKAHLNWIANHL